MMMKYEEFLERIINDGIQSACEHFKEGSAKRYGSLSGFDLCRGRTVQQLVLLLIKARRDVKKAQENRDALERGVPIDYWYWKYREIQVEWVCNVVSAALHNEGKPVIIPPTVRGMRKAADILGVKGIRELVNNGN